MENLASGIYTVTVTDDNGCAVTNSVEVDEFVSVENIVNNEINIYPNLAEEYIIVEFDLLQLPAYIKLSGINGELVFERKTVSLHEKINTTVYAPGIYILNIFADNRNIAEK